MPWPWGSCPRSRDVDHVDHRLLCDPDVWDLGDDDAGHDFWDERLALQQDLSRNSGQQHFPPSIKLDRDRDLDLRLEFSYQKLNARSQCFGPNADQIC